MEILPGCRVVVFLPCIVVRLVNETAQFAQRRRLLVFLASDWSRIRRASDEHLAASFQNSVHLGLHGNPVQEFGIPVVSGESCCCSGQNWMLLVRTWSLDCEFVDCGLWRLPVNRPMFLTPGCWPLLSSQSPVISPLATGTMAGFQEDQFIVFRVNSPSATFSLFTFSTCSGFAGVLALAGTSGVVCCSRRLGRSLVFTTPFAARVLTLATLVLDPLLRELAPLDADETLDSDDPLSTEETLELRLARVSMPAASKMASASSAFFFSLAVSKNVDFASRFGWCRMTFLVLVRCFRTGVGIRAKRRSLAAADWLTRDLDLWPATTLRLTLPRTRVFLNAAARRKMEGETTMVCGAISVWRRKTHFLKRPKWNWLLSPPLIWCQLLEIRNLRWSFSNAPLGLCLLLFKKRFFCGNLYYSRDKMPSYQKNNLFREGQLYFSGGLFSGLEICWVGCGFCVCGLSLCSTENPIQWRHKCWSKQKTGDPSCVWACLLCSAIFWRKSLKKLWRKAKKLSENVPVALQSADKTFVAHWKLSRTFSLSKLWHLFPVCKCV